MRRGVFVSDLVDNSNLHFFLTKSQKFPFPSIIIINFNLVSYSRPRRKTILRRLWPFPLELRRRNHLPIKRFPAVLRKMPLPKQHVQPLPRHKPPRTIQFCRKSASKSFIRRDRFRHPASNFFPTASTQTEKHKQRLLFSSRRSTGWFS